MKKLKTWFYVKLTDFLFPRYKVQIEALFDEMMREQFARLEELHLPKTQGACLNPSCM